MLAPTQLSCRNSDEGRDMGDRDALSLRELYGPLVDGRTSHSAFTHQPLTLTSVV